MGSWPCSPVDKGLLSAGGLAHNLMAPRETPRPWSAETGSMTQWLGTGHAICTECGRSMSGLGLKAGSVKEPRHLHPEVFLAIPELVWSPGSKAPPQMSDCHHARPR